MMWNQVQTTAELLKHWWLTLSIDPSTWVPFTWVLVAVLAVIVLLLAIRPRRRPSRRPELLISHGELRVTEDAEAASTSLLAPDRGSFELSMIVSNLSAVPVQLLELAVRTNASPAPTTAEVPAVLPPHGAVEVRADLREAGGDEGTLELFVYAPDMPPKTFRLRAKLLWEPWNTRFRVLPLDQRVDVARGFAERSGVGAKGSRRQRRAAVDRRAYRARFPEAASEEEEEVRFQPRAESARPRASSWPEPAGRGGERGERWERGASSPWDAPGGSGATWPPRRPMSWGGEPGAAGEGPRRGREGPARGQGAESAPAAGSKLNREADSGEELLETDHVAGTPEADGYRLPGRGEAGRGGLGQREGAQRGPERGEAGRPAADREAWQRRERERREAERSAAEREERGRRERERLDREHREAARRAAERAETERREAARRERERLERERREAERLAAERLERQRRESEGREAARLEAEGSRAARPESGSPPAAPAAEPRSDAGSRADGERGWRRGAEGPPGRESAPRGETSDAAPASELPRPPGQAGETHRPPPGPGRGRGQRARDRRDATVGGAEDADVSADDRDAPDRMRESPSPEGERGEPARSEGARSEPERRDAEGESDDEAEAPRRPRLEFPDEF